MPRVEEKEGGGAAVPAANKSETFFPEVGKQVDDDAPNITEIPGSLCMSCGESGITRMIFTKVPFFREIIVSSFECDHCGYTNNEVQFGGEIKEQGCRYELSVTDAKDLNRQVIKSDTASIFIPDLELEIPAKTQRGSVNTIEGVFQATIDGLQAEQEYRRQVAPEVADKVAALIARLALYMTGNELPFSFIVDDPAGNSFVENYHAPKPDPQMKVTHYTRTAMQDLEVGLQPTQAAKEAGYIEESRPDHHAVQSHQQVEGVERLITSEDDDADKLGRTEVIRFPMDCPNCHVGGEVVNAVTDIPGFKEVIIMAFDCQECGYRSNEIKGGGAIPALGTVTRLRIESRDDFARDVLKSDTAGIHIPEIDLEITQGSLGGFYTTVEGLLSKIRDHLQEGNPFGVGDSAVKHHANTNGGEDEESALQVKFRSFMARLDEMVEGKVFPFTLEIKDPLGNSFIKFNGMKPEDDPQVTSEDYQRDWDEDEQLGLHDMKTEGYETGYEGKYQEPIISDLKTRGAHKMGHDHPTAFTRGCDDSLPPKPTNHDSNHVAAPVQIVNEDGVEFEPSNSFVGPRPGWTFKSGTKGVGYYRDVHSRGTA